MNEGLFLCGVPAALMWVVALCATWPRVRYVVGGIAMVAFTCGVLLAGARLASGLLGAAAGGAGGIATHEPVPHLVLFPVSLVTWLCAVRAVASAVRRWSALTRRGVVGELHVEGSALSFVSGGGEAREIARVEEWHGLDAAAPTSGPVVVLPRELPRPAGSPYREGRGPLHLAALARGTMTEVRERTSRAALETIAVTGLLLSVLAVPLLALALGAH